MSIKNNIQLPDKGGVGSRSKWPWHEMEVGDSFLMGNQSIVRAASLACKANDRLGFKFSCRTEGENVRVWRVS